jgi:plasmid maintenance system antidote protein VapI
LQVEITIKELLRKYGVSRSAAVDLGSRLDVSRQTASKIINGRKTLSNVEIGQICEWLVDRVSSHSNISVEDLGALRQS